MSTRREIETCCQRAVTLAFGGVEEASMASARIQVAPAAQQAIDAWPLLHRAIEYLESALAELREAEEKLLAMDAAQLCAERSAKLGDDR